MDWTSYHMRYSFLDEQEHACLAALQTELASAREPIKDGIIKSMESSRQQAPQPGHGRVAMTQAGSFEAAHQAVDAIAKAFASYCETER